MRLMICSTQMTILVTKAPGPPRGSGSLLVRPLRGPHHLRSASLADADLLPELGEGQASGFLDSASDGKSQVGRGVGGNPEGLDKPAHLTECSLGIGLGLNLPYRLTDGLLHSRPRLAERNIAGARAIHDISS